MIEQLEIYKCQGCGVVAEVLDGGAGELACCGQSMQRLTAKTAEEGKEKHLPVVEKIDGGVRVKVGSVPHPMQEKHFIQWIEVLAEGRVCRRFLRPGQAPEAEFCIEAEKVAAREHCNIHGLWKG